MNFTFVIWGWKTRTLFEWWRGQLRFRFGLRHWVLCATGRFPALDDFAHQIGGIIDRARTTITDRRLGHHRLARNMIIAEPRIASRAARLGVIDALLNRTLIPRIAVGGRAVGMVGPIAMRV